MDDSFHSILVPVDFSPHSAEALRYAATFADRFTASLLVLHILPKNPKSMVRGERLSSPDTVHHALSCASHLLANPHMATEAITVNPHDRTYEALRSFLPPQLDREQVELRIVNGRPCEEILFLARQEQVDLIVMGTHARMGLEYLAMGSVAEQVVRMSPCPVFTVKRPPSFSNRVVR